LIFVRKWMKQENIFLSEVGQAQKAKNHVWENKCSNIIGHRSHSKGRLPMGGIRKEKENKILDVVDVISVYEWIQ
jgi:hypothetical protein